MAQDKTDAERSEQYRPARSPRKARSGGAVRKLARPLDTEARLAGFKRNDLGNAKRLLSRYGRDLMYVREFGWHAFNGTYWSAVDGGRRAQVAAQETASAIFAETKAMEALDQDTEAATHRKWALQSGNSQRLAAMLHEAEPHLTRKVEDLDADPNLLNVLNGTLALFSDVRGGVRLRAHRRQDLITKVASVKYDPEASCPRFRKFLDEILPDKDLQNFLQRWCGYCLTGDTREQSLVILFGMGSNGKSTFVESLVALLGDYARTMPIASLLYDDRRRGSEATPDLARLTGARLVAAAEPEVGSRFAESLLKNMTGGEKLAVRHLNRGFFELDPQFKLIVSCNNHPAIRGQDEGIWRRILLVPFTQYISPAQRDRELGAKLLAEQSGILNWALDGLRMWRETGLTVPKPIRVATDEYRSECDPVGQFLENSTKQSPGMRVRARDLYSAYCRWCRENAASPVTSTLFGRILGERGYERSKTGVIYYENLELIEPLDASSEESVT